MLRLRRRFRSLLQIAQPGLVRAHPPQGGLPLFPADWTKSATFPQAGGLVSASVGGAVREGAIRERDLSVQLSGWMLMEAAARVAEDARRKTDSPGQSPHTPKGPSCE